MPCEQRQCYDFCHHENQTDGIKQTAAAIAWSCLFYPVVFVVLKHADTVFDDEEEVDAGQRR